MSLFDRAPVCIGLGADVSAALDAGSRGAYSHDEATTIAFNIADQPFLSALADDRVIYANHPFGSIVGQVIWRLGGTTELWQRLPSVLAAGMLVTLVLYWVNRRWSAPVALSAAAVIVLNPLFLSYARAVRGYSMMMLGVATATALFDYLVRHNDVKPAKQRWMSAAYVAAVGLAIGSHAYGGIALLAHIAYLVAANRQALPEWRNRFGAALLLAGSCYSLLIADLLHGRGRAFRADFPIRTLEAFGSGQRAVAIALGVAFFAGLWKVGRQPGPKAAIAVSGASIALVWLVVAPFDLYPRFLLCLFPAYALCVAVGLERLRWLGTACVMAITLTGFLSARDELHDSPPAREIASLGEEVSRTGATVCAIDWTSFVYLPYTESVREVRDTSNLDECSLVFTYAGYYDEVLEENLELLPHQGTWTEQTPRFVLAWTDDIDELVTQHRVAASSVAD